MILKKLLVFILCFILVFTSCRKKIVLPDWDVNVIFPVANTSLQITDLIKDSVLKVNADQSLSLVYSGEVYKLNFDSLFQIPDTSVYQSFKCIFCGAGIQYPANATIINQTQNTKYNLNTVELTQAIIRTGSIEVELRSTFQGKTVLIYQMPLAIDSNGNSLSITDTLPAASPGNPTIIIKSYDLKGYNIDLRGINGNSFNTVVSNFKAITMEPTFVTSSDSVRIFNTFKNIIPEFAKGYFGQSLVVAEPVNQAVNKLHNILGGVLDIKYFDLTMKIKNGIGLDIQFSLQQINSSKISSGENVSLTGSVIGSTININRAATNNSLPYPPITYSEYIIKMNNSNSNADKLIEIFPDSISAGAEITLNPMGNISNSNDFVYYGNGINVTLDTEIPLYLAANNLILADTVAINFQNGEENGEKDPSKKIIGGNLILDVYNGYPFRAIPQLYLMDENFTLADSLVAASSIIEAADLNSNFYSPGKKFSKIFIPIDQDKIKKLKAAKNLMIKLYFSSASQPNYVKIYSEYSVDIKIVADISYQVENN